MQCWGEAFAAKCLTICQNAGGGAARTDGGEGELCGTSATRRKAVTADAKNAESAVPENGGSAKNGEATWGTMARERKLTTKNGGLCAQAGRYSTKRGVVSAERGKLSIENGEKWTKRGTF